MISTSCLNYGKEVYWSFINGKICYDLLNILVMGSGTGVGIHSVVFLPLLQERGMTHLITFEGNNWTSLAQLHHSSWKWACLSKHMWALLLEAQNCLPLGSWGWSCLCAYSALGCSLSRVRVLNLTSIIVIFSLWFLLYLVFWTFFFRIEENKSDIGTIY